MDDVLKDVKKELLAHPRLAYIKRAGGVVESQSIELFPLQSKLPAIVLIEEGTSEVKHWSSRKRWMGFRLKIYAVQQIFDREGVLVGKINEPGVNGVARDIRFVLDMNRLKGRYARFLLVSEDKTELFNAGNNFLLGKPLTFDVARIE